LRLTNRGERSDLVAKLIASCVAIIVSTADSYLLASSTSLAADFTSRQPTPLTQRIIVIGLGVLAYIISVLDDRYFEVALYAYTLYGASLTPAILCALLRPHTPRAAVVWSMSVGLATALIWQALVGLDRLPEAVSSIDAVLPSLGSNLAVLITLSIMCRDQARKPTAPAD